jgi:hypothetical protein
VTGRHRTIAVAGAVAQRSGVGGHTWVLLQYLLGFRRLGWDVLFLDHLDSGACVDDAGAPCPAKRSTGVRYLLDVMRRVGLQNAFSLAIDDGRRTVGLSRQDVRELLGSAALVVNVNGFLRDEELLDRVPLRVLLDIDPGFGQMWQDLGLHAPFRDHDAYVTVGQNIGRPGCAVPTCGLPWITTPPPVVLEHWPDRSAAGGEQFTSIGSWRGSVRALEYHGRMYGLRSHEFRKFAHVPRLSGRDFQLALRIDPAERADLELLRDGGWSLVDPRAVAGDPWTYRGYIQRSRAEFMVAKTMYVETQTGWFSDRSACYLASGKPVVAQDTGLAGHYPLGEGLLAFSSVDQALTAVEEVARNYERHARAARALAETHFDSDRVLTRLLRQLDVLRPVGAALR